MKAAFTHPDEQYRLVMECRSSGLTDKEWCSQHGINVGTFYTWVKRLRKNGYTGIPSPQGRNTVAVKQEVVRIDPASLAAEHNPSPEPSSLSSTPVEYTIAGQGPVLEVMIGGNVIRITNGISPALVDQTFRLMKELSC